MSREWKRFITKFWYRLEIRLLTILWIRLFSSLPAQTFAFINIEDRYFINSNVAKIRFASDCYKRHLQKKKAFKRMSSPLRSPFKTNADKEREKSDLNLWIFFFVSGNTREVGRILDSYTNSRLRFGFTWLFRLLPTPHGNFCSNNYRV